MRREPTPAEERLWDRLRSRRLAGSKFRRQHPIGRFVVDFYCVERGLAIEVDGPIHEEQPDEDRARQEYLEQRKRFRRFTNDEIQQNIERVLSDIRAALVPPAPPLHAVERGLGGEVLAPAPDPEREAPR